jgi:hypothetical protein
MPPDWKPSCLGIWNFTSRYRPGKRKPLVTLRDSGLHCSIYFLDLVRGKACSVRTACPASCCSCRPLSRAYPVSSCRLQTIGLRAHIKLPAELRLPNGWYHHAAPSRFGCGCGCAACTTLLRSKKLPNGESPAPGLARIILNDG